MKQNSLCLPFQLYCVSDVKTLLTETQITASALCFIALGETGSHLLCFGCMFTLIQILCLGLMQQIFFWCRLLTVGHPLSFSVTFLYVFISVVWISEILLCSSLIWFTKTFVVVAIFRFTLSLAVVVLESAGDDDGCFGGSTDWIQDLCILLLILTSQRNSLSF